MPDPDIFYCRAEIVRDTNRKQAISDLNRYLATSERSLVSNEEKQTRVKGLVAALEACIKKGTKTCVAEWEHPRLDRTSMGPAGTEVSENKPEEPFSPVLLISIVALLLLVVAIVIRRRSARGE